MEGPFPIVGGGPAGCSTGIFLAKSGYDNVTIYEKSPNRRKACGGGISWKVLRRYKELVRGVDSFSVRKVMIDFDGEIINFTFRKRIGAIIDRLEFDKNLREVARSYGVNFVNRRADPERLGGRLVFDASGFKKTNGMAICVQSFCKMKDPVFSLVFRRDINPKGYFWIFPLSEDKANIGIGGVAEDFRMPMFNSFHKLAAEFGLKIGKKFAHPMSYYDSSIDIVGKSTEGSILKVGEAASLVNPTTGEGIYHALRSGEIAAESASKENPEDFYKKSIKSEFGSEFRMSNVTFKTLVSAPKFICKSTLLTLFKLVNNRL
jgi:flavin-dependent dehydrogenase